MLRRRLAAMGVAAVLPLAACGGDTDQAPADGGRKAAVEAAPAPATGSVIEVRLITDEEGNYFEPNEVEARRGDVVRYVLVSGVHNVSFPADSNAGASGLPGPGAYLQLPGQSYDVKVDFAPGRYYFQCDPHAALGMVGHLTIRE